MVTKRMYELIYRVPFVPIEWIFGPLIPDLKERVESGRIAPCRAIDLGCGVGVEAIYLSRNGFDVTGVDFSPTAIKRARQNAQEAGLDVKFVEDDLTSMRQIGGVYDLLLDIGALNDMKPKARDRYLQNVLPLTRSGSLFLLMCFEESLPASEVAARFGEHFKLESPVQRSEGGLMSRQIMIYWMTRK